MVKNYKVGLKNKTKVFNASALLESVKPDFRDSTEHMNTLRRLILSEAIDLITYDESEQPYVYGRYTMNKQLEHYFEPEFVDTFESTSNALSSFIVWVAVDLRAVLLAAKALTPTAAPFFANSINFDHFTVSIEEGDAAIVEMVCSSTSEIHI